MSYNYKKVFFRRPILTESNLMFFWFLFLTAIVIIPVVIYAVHFFDRIPTQGAIQELKNYTFSRLLNIPRSSIIAPAAEAGAASSLGADLPADEPPEEEVAGSSTDPAVITRAVPENTREPESALLRYQQVRQSYEESKKQYALADEELRISSPGFTDFGVVRGYRSFEQTVAKEGDSKRFVQTCLDRFFLNHPRVSGKIIVRFEIDPRGHVIAESIEIVHSDIADESLLECIRKSIRRWVTYPEIPAAQGIYPMTQKFIF